MITVYAVTLTEGRMVNATTLEQVRSLLADDPGALVQVQVRYTPCARHRAYEASNCPVCGTAGAIKES